MSDVREPTHEMLGVFHTFLGAHRSRPEFKCVTFSVHAIILVVLAAIESGLGGCGSSPSPPLSPLSDGGTSDGGHVQVCRGPQPTPTMAKACGCDADCDLGEFCADEATTGYPGGNCVRGCAD